MNGYYLYCIKEADGCKSYSKGINESEVFSIPFQDLEAVVSAVPLEKFSSEEIKKKAREDLNWIKENAQVHEKIIESAMLSYPAHKDADSGEQTKVSCVIPMRFGIIFSTKKKLERTLKQHYAKFSETLKHLSGKQEWALKVYLNREIFEQEIKNASPVVQEKEKEIASLPEGIAYFMQKQIDDIVAKESDNILQKYTEDFFNRLKKHSFDGVEGKLLGEELTGNSLPMVLNAIYLVSEQKFEDFLREVNEFKDECGTKGFDFEYSGPWPPYHFVPQF